jgi:restriction system protein
MTPGLVVAVADKCVDERLGPSAWNVDGGHGDARHQLDEDVVGATFAEPHRTMWASTRTERGNMTKQAWVIRAGRNGEREAWALEVGVAGGGFKEVADLTSCISRQEVRTLVEATYPSKTKAFVSNFTGQLWALRDRIKVDDLVVMPIKTTGMIAIGTVKDNYEYRADPDGNRRHVRQVGWHRSDVPRTAIQQDLLFTLNGAATVFGCTRNDAVWRLQRVFETGSDPGARTGLSVSGASPGTGDELDDVTTATTIDLERVARDAITQAVIEKFAGHQLASVTAEILRAQGFTCTVSPPGPDGGVDVYAARGPLGLDPPRLVVQVKSDATPIGAPVVQQLHGALSTNGADQALLVAWGGLTKPAQLALAGQQFRVRVWDADTLVHQLCKYYPLLSEELRAELPLKQVWTIVPDDDLATTES